MKKILIIEDEKSLISALSDKFKKVGYEVLEAADGQLGLDMAIKEHPDLILLDIVMPVMDGMKVLENLRKDDWGKKARIILLTNLSDAEKEAECRNQGAHDYLIKSDWKIDDIVKKVDKELK